MKVIHRVDETVRSGTVISREPPRTIQVAAGADGVVPCNERWARNVWVALRVGSQTYRLGAPSPRGEVIANLSGELKQSLYGEAAPSEATVVVNGIDAGKISLEGYTSHEARVGALLDELRAILSKDEAQLTKEDIARSYELYEQTAQLDTGNDARIAGLRTRFLELVYQRKQHEATENLRRNIKVIRRLRGAGRHRESRSAPLGPRRGCAGGPAIPRALLTGTLLVESALRRRLLAQVAARLLVPALRVRRPVPDRGTRALRAVPLAKARGAPRPPRWRAR